MAPSNSVPGSEKLRRISYTCEDRSDVISCADVCLLPLPVLTVVGLKAFHTMVSQMLVAMNKEIPEPRPYPFWSSSSSSRTIMPATNSCARKIAKRTGSAFACTRLFPAHRHTEKASSKGKAHLDDDEQADPCAHL